MVRIFNIVENVQVYVSDRKFNLYKNENKLYAIKYITTHNKTMYIKIIYITIFNEKYFFGIYIVLHFQKVLDFQRTCFK